MRLRKREPELERPYRVWGYPWTPMAFIALSGWMVVYTLVDRPSVAFAGLLTVATGLGLYAVVRRHQPGFAATTAAAEAQNAPEQAPEDTARVRADVEVAGRVTSSVTSS